MNIYVDIDGTICVPNCTPPDWDYSNATPLLGNIAKINALYKKGHRIVYWTARGSVSGRDWTGVTSKQLVQWGALHHEIRLGKPAYDVFIDDKNLSNVWLDGLGEQQFVDFIESKLIAGHHRES